MTVKLVIVEMVVEPNMAEKTEVKVTAKIIECIRVFSGITFFPFRRVSLFIILKYFTLCWHSKSSQVLQDLSLPAFAFLVVIHTFFNLVADQSFSVRF